MFPGTNTIQWGKEREEAEEQKKRKKQEYYFKKMSRERGKIGKIIGENFWKKS